MKRTLLLLVALVGILSLKGQVAGELITAHGAIADGQTNNAAAIQQLINKVSAGGGGRVRVPPGNFMSGPLYLKSGVELHLEPGARLLASARHADYGDRPGRAAAFISARDQTGISITGSGVIDGQGQELMLDLFKRLRSGEVKQDSTWRYKRPEGRPLLLTFTGCSNVKVTGVTLKNSADWVQDYRECNGVTIDGITVQSTAYWNNDGIDITDSKNVTITNCFINASDDALCFKSENPGSSCENIVVENCTLRSSASGLKFGTRSDGGFKNIKVRNLTIFDTYRSAIALESVDGGRLEQIDIRDVYAKNTGNAIFIRRGHRNAQGAVGTLKGIYIANVKVETPLLKPDQGYPIEGPPDHLRPGFDRMPVRPSSFHIYGHPFLPYNLVPSSIVGLPGYPVEDVTLENIEISYGGRARKEIAHIPLHKITTVPENPANYPEFSMFGELPSWGFYIRHATGIKMINVTLRYVEDDFRPAMVVDDVKGISLVNVKIPTVKELPVIQLNNTTGYTAQGLELPVTGNKTILTTNYR